MFKDWPALFGCVLLNKAKLHSHRVEWSGIAVRRMMVIIALTALLFSCSVYSTSKDPISRNRVAGQLYYLPIGMIHITGGYGAPAGTALSASASNGAKQTKSQVTTTAGNPSDVASNNTPAPLSNTPGSGAGPNNSPYVISVSADIRADPTARYYLKQNRNYFFDDTTALSINGKHLLSTGNAIALDETPTIISTTVGLAAQALMPGPSAAAGVTGAGGSAALKTAGQALAGGTKTMNQHARAQYTLGLDGGNPKVDIIKKDVKALNPLIAQVETLLYTLKVPEITPLQDAQKSIVEAQTALQDAIDANPPGNPATETPQQKDLDAAIKTATEQLNRVQGIVNALDSLIRIAEVIAESEKDQKTYITVGDLRALLLLYPQELEVDKNIVKDINGLISAKPTNELSDFGVTFGGASATTAATGKLPTDQDKTSDTKQTSAPGIPTYSFKVTHSRVPVFEASGSEQDQLLPKILNHMPQGHITLGTLGSFLSYYPQAALVRAEVADSLEKYLNSGKRARPFDIMIDPQVFGCDCAYREKIKHQILDCGFKLKLCRKDQKQFASMVSPFRAQNPNDVNGIVFRAVGEYEVQISSDVPSITVNAIENIMLPDTERQFVLDYSRMLFVQKTTNVSFADGMMQDYSQIVPSPINGFLQIPKAIIQAILPVSSGKSGGGSGSTSSSSTL
jgi:hypothetical protein